MADFPVMPQVGVPCPVPVLPTVFDESLSYYELLAKLWQQCKELTDLVNAETIEVNRLREKINEILPYIDQLATISEEMQQLSESLSSLQDELYNAETGDINIIEGQIASLNAQISAFGTMANSALYYASRQAQYAGNNVLKEIYHLTDETRRGIRVKYDPDSGWFRLSGTLTAGDAFKLKLAEYTAKDIFNFIPDRDVTTSSIISANRQILTRFKAFFLGASTTVTEQNYSGIISVGYWNENQTQFNVLDKIGNENPEDFRFRRSIETAQLSLYLAVPQSQAVEAEINCYICPTAVIDNPDGTVPFVKMFPIITNGSSALDLSKRITAEEAARSAAVSGERTERIAADSALEALITSEATTRENEDDALSALIETKLSAADVFGVGTAISATADAPVSLDDVTIPGQYLCGASAAAYVTKQPNHGAATSGFRMGVAQMFTTGGRVRQTIRYNSTALAGKIFERIKYSGGWSSWYVYTGTVVPDPE